MTEGGAAPAPMELAAAALPPWMLKRAAPEPTSAPAGTGTRGEAPPSPKVPRMGADVSRQAAKGAGMARGRAGDLSVEDRIELLEHRVAIVKQVFLLHSNDIYDLTTIVDGLTKKLKETGSSQAQTKAKMEHGMGPPHSHTAAPTVPSCALTHQGLVRALARPERMTELVVDIQLLPALAAQIEEDLLQALLARVNGPQMEPSTTESASSLATAAPPPLSGSPPPPPKGAAPEATSAPAGTGTRGEAPPSPKVPRMGADVSRQAAKGAGMARGRAGDLSDEDRLELLEQRVDILRKAFLLHSQDIREVTANVDGLTQKLKETGSSQAQTKGKMDHGMGPPHSHTSAATVSSCSATNQGLVCAAERAELVTEFMCGDIPLPPAVAKQIWRSWQRSTAHSRGEPSTRPSRASARSEGASAARCQRSLGGLAASGL